MTVTINDSSAPERLQNPQTPPGPVTNIRVTHTGTSLTVSWDAPTGATHYDVTYSGGGVTGRAAWNRAGTSLTITRDSRPGHGNRVDSGATYTVGVRARNAAGTSAWTNSAAVASGQSVGASLNRMTVSAGADMAASEIAFSPGLSPLAAAFAAASPPQAPYADLIGQMHEWRNEPPWRAARRSSLPSRRVQAPAARTRYYGRQLPLPPCQGGILNTTG